MQIAEALRNKQIWTTVTILANYTTYLSSIARCFSVAGVSVIVLKTEEARWHKETRSDASIWASRPNFAPFYLSAYYLVLVATTTFMSAIYPSTILDSM